MTLDLKPGDPWPFRSVRGLTGAPIEPTWYALITAPQREARAKDQLARVDVEVQYPTIDKVRHARGKRYDIVQPTISQIIYARFNYQPQWDVLRDRRIITGVFTRNGAPIALSSDDISRAMAMPTEAERIRAEMEDAMRPRAGERAEIIDGPFSGFYVDVTRVQAGRVWYDMLTGIKGQADQSAIRRIVG